MSSPMVECTTWRDVWADAERQVRLGPTPTPRPMTRIVRTCSALFLATAGTACDFPMTSCIDESRAADACVKATDLFRYMTPQLGYRSAAGNAAPGEGGVLPAGKRISFAASVGNSSTYAPRMSATASESSVAASQYDSDLERNVLARADIALNIIPRYRGLIGVDILASVAQTAGGSLGSIVVEEHDPLSFGGGLRIGTAPDSTRRRPVFALTVFATDHGARAFRSTTPNGGIHVADMLVSTGLWHISGAKEWERFGVTGGFGRGFVTSEATVRGWVSTVATSPSVFVAHDVDISSQYAGGTYRVGRTKLFVEVARAGLSSVAPSQTNSFSPNEGSSRTMVTLGARIGS